ncbi:MAG: DHA2 family efflux MFS transporter permease subunit [Flavobacteriales bacterium]|nr:DHA2 family efflux MFS transporter permease subunit [Flavobacteriales bacterium]MBK9288812.1 DHA2 family efflux MFS transporter permease subunit [Flavobacteriales bacterium]MBL0035652.1 DHA2 family efflux MFS transporter permease subunit [Flavobacteriales bacterium]
MSTTAIPDQRNLRVLPWLVAVGLFMENLDISILNTAVPTIAEDLGTSALSLKAVLTTYTLALAVFIPISGWMADRYGTRRIFRMAVALFTIGSLLCGLSQNLPMLVASRFLQGVGGAMMTPVGRIALIRAYPRSQMLAMMNFVVIPALIAPLLGPFIGGFMVHWLPWQTIFFVNLPIGIVGWWMIRRYMPDHVDRGVAPLDGLGMLLFGAGIALLSYVLEVFGEHTWPPTEITIMLLTSIVLLVAYGIHSRRAPHPLLHMEVFLLRTFRVSVIGGFITRLGVGGMPFLLPLLYQIGLGYSPLEAGLLTTPLALGAIGMKIMSGALLKRFGHRTVLVWNTVLLGLNIAAFHFIGIGSPFWLIGLLSLSQGIFSSLQFTCMNSLTFADVKDTDASKATSISSTAQQMALSFGVASASLVAALFLKEVSQSETAAYIEGLHLAFVVLGLFTVLSSLTFRGLRASDGSNVSHFVAARS